MKSRSQSRLGPIAVVTGALGLMLVSAVNVAAADHDPPGKPITVMTVTSTWARTSTHRCARWQASPTRRRRATLGRATFDPEGRGPDELPAPQRVVGGRDRRQPAGPGRPAGGRPAQRPAGADQGRGAECDDGRLRLPEILLQDLTEAGMEYRAVSVQQEADVEAQLRCSPAPPATSGSPCAT